MNFKLKHVKIIAYVAHNTKENNYTIYTLNPGGPIISDDDLETAKARFEKASKIYTAVRNFLYFKGANRASSHEVKLDFIEGMRERVGSIEYVTQPSI